jgi:undecaprenyl-phosphate 4-deoxy-4-formamido-L-arabinose transferase
MSGPTPSLSVVVPVFNSARILPELVTRLEPVLARETRAFELVLVDDHSKDESWEVVQELARRHAWVRGIRLMRNYGQHNALLCGIRSARHELVLTMDDDLQHPPDQIPLLLAHLARGHDVVYGYPREERHGLWRDLASRITKWVLQKAMGSETARRSSAFRLFRAHLREAFAAYQSQFVSIDVLLTWGTTRFDAVAVRHDPRKVGSSNYTLRKLVVHALNMLTGFSVFPLQLASWIGFAATVFGLLVLVYVVARYVLEGSGVPGFPFLASIVALFSGAQLFALGIIGEYLARMHFRMMERPPYTVGARTPGETASP